MKLFNHKLELRAIKSICDSERKYKNKLLAVLQEEHFHSPPSVEAIKRIKTLVRSSGEIPGYVELCTDPVMSEDTRKILSKFEVDPISSTKRMTEMVKQIHQYYQMRKLYFLSEQINEALLKDKIDIEELLEKAANEVTRARVKSDANQPIFHIGTGNNSTSLIKDMLNDDKVEYLPTGFNNFDQRSAGVFYGGLMLIGGTSGGGKSALVINLLKNFTKGAESVAYVPLEMTEHESSARLMSDLSKVPISKILQKKLASGEKKAIKKAYKKYVEEMKKLGNRFTIYSPEEDMSAEEILLMLKPYNHKVIVIDYISLLKGVDDENSWQQLGKVARMCKIYAKNNNMIIVLLVQINDEGKIRYSKAVVEHANLAWFFVATDETKEAGILNIKQVKARNQPMYDFQLAFDASTMSITDVDGSYSAPTPEDKDESSDDKPMDDLNNRRKKKREKEDS